MTQHVWKHYYKNTKWWQRLFLGYREFDPNCDVMISRRGGIAMNTEKFFKSQKFRDQLEALERIVKYQKP